MSTTLELINNILRRHEKLFDEVRRLFDELDRVFTRLTIDVLTDIYTPIYIDAVIPVFEVREFDKEVVLFVNLPGFSKQNVKLWYVPEKNVLIIEGFREVEGEKKQVKYVIPITWDVDVNKVTAYMREGLLVIRLPRREIPKREIKIE